MKAYIEAGAAAVHFEDQLSSEKKCGHLGGKVLVPTSQFVRTLVAARLAADVARRADADRRAHRRALGLAADERRRRRRPRVLHRRAHPGGVLPRPRRASSRRSRAASPTRRTPTSSGARPRRPTWTRPSSSRRRSTSATRASSLAYNCSPSFNWRQAPERRADRGLPARARRAGLPVPVHHPGRLPRAQPLDVRARPRLSRRGDDRLRPRCRSASSSSRTTATRPRATSARSAPATSTRSCRRSPAGLVDARAERLDRGEQFEAERSAA